MKQLIDTIEDTFRKSTLDELKAYLGRFPLVHDFILASDYCIGDKSKTNDSLSFVIFPKIRQFFQYQEEISRLLPKDIKKTRTVNPELRKVLSGGTVFVFNFILPRGTRRILRNLPREHASASIVASLEMIGLWIKNEPRRKNQYSKRIERFQRLKQEQLKKSFNMNLFADLVLVATIAAYLTHKIMMNSTAKEVIWFSDRDDMTTFGDGVIYDLYSMQHNALARSESPEKAPGKISIGRSSTTEECWYDEIIRLADYFSGTYADFDLAEKDVTAEKYKTIIELSTANVSNILLDQDPTDYSTIKYHASRLVIRNLT